MKRSEILFSTLLVPIDALALFLAFILSYYLRDQFTFSSPANVAALAERLKYNPLTTIALPFEQYLRYLIVIIPVMLLIFAFVGLYTIRSHVSWPRKVAQILVGVSVGEGFILFLFLLKKDFFIPRGTVLYSWVLGTLFVLLGRLLVRGIQKVLQRYNIATVKVAVIGKNVAAHSLLRQLKAYTQIGYRLVAHLDHLPVQDILHKISRYDLDELIVVNEAYTTEDLIVLRNYCLEQHISFSFVPSLMVELQCAFESRTLVGLPMIEVRPTPLEGWGRVVKRLFDIVVSLSLIVLFLPLFLLIAITLKLTSPGPLFYRHKRIGKNRLPIYVWKFRSMKREFCTGRGYNGDKAFAKLLEENPHFAEEWRLTHKLKNDPRVSWFGNVLRKSSLDELPQLFNVLGGSLSLVGPRPIVEDEITKYGESARMLFTIRPGMTGLWQVSGRSDTTYADRINLDLAYIEHWNLGKDVLILLRTAWSIIKKGAY